MFDDDQETPNTLNCAFEFDLANGKRKMMEFEVRHWTTNSEADIGRGNLAATKKKFFGHHNTIGNIFYGSDGYLAAGDEDDSSYEVWDRDGHSGSHHHASGDHGRSLRFDPDTETVVGDDEANRLLWDQDRGYRSPFVVPEEV